MTDKEFYKKMTYKTKCVYDELNSEQTKEMIDLCERYKVFLDLGKTERECVKEAEKAALENGFSRLEEHKELKPGDRVYAINREKNILLAVIGEENMESGLNIVGAHIDSPRLDLKQNP